MGRSSTANAALLASSMGVLGVCLLGCEAPDFDSPSEVVNLRILGLQASQQLVAPGDRITLDALWVDSQPVADGEVISAWFPGCINPDFGAVESCLEDLNDLEPEPGEQWPAAFAPHEGEGVEFEVNPDLLAGRADYGIQFFFFAVCRGSRFEFAPSQHPTVPLICRDASGNTVHQPDFRVGYRTVTALPAIPDIPLSNPAIVGFEVDGEAFEPHCVGDACRGYHRPDCGIDPCPRVESAADCEPEDGEDCEGDRIRVLVDHESIGPDWLASDYDNPESVEVYARYFSSDGEVYPEFDLLHSREPWGESAGWNSEPSSAVLGLGDLFLWAVVYDSTGGVSWAGIGLQTY